MYLYKLTFYDYSIIKIYKIEQMHVEKFKTNIMSGLIIK